MAEAAATNAEMAAEAGDLAAEGLQPGQRLVL